MALLELIPAALASDALAEMEEEEKPGELLASMEPERIAEIVEELADDDAADLIGELDPEEQARVFESVPDEEEREIRHLLEYPEESAGGIMTRELCAVDSEATAAAAIEALRAQAEESEDLYTVFVVGRRGRLRGVVTLPDPRARGAGYAHLRPARGAPGRGFGGSRPGGGGEDPVSLQPRRDRGRGRRGPAGGTDHLRRRDRCRRGGGHRRHPALRRGVGRGTVARDDGRRDPEPVAVARRERAHPGGRRGRRVAVPRDDRTARDPRGRDAGHRGAGRQRGHAGARGHDPPHRDRRRTARRALVRCREGTRRGPGERGRDRAARSALFAAAPEYRGRSSDSS